MLRRSCLYFATLLNFLVANSSQNIVVFGERETENYITKCIIEISKRELFWRPTIVLKIEKEQTTNKSIFNNEVIKMLNIEEVPFIIKEDINDGTINATSANYLAINFYEDCNALTKFDINLIEDKVKYLIIIQNYSNKICRQNFKGIGKIIGKNDISFVVEKTKNVFEMYTFVPEIDPNTCVLIVRIPVKVNTCDTGKLMENNVFPVKYPSNFNKCPIKVGMSSLYPFAIIENKSYLKDNERISESQVKGVDLELIKTILNHFNATIDLYFISKVEQNALANKEFIELVLNGSLEVCAGGLYRIYGDIVDYSGVYASQKITWMYYAERFSKTWETLIPTVDGLYLFMIFYFGYSVVLYVITKFDKKAVSLMQILLFAWGSLVGSTSLLNAKTLKQKILNAGYLIMCLHLMVYMNIQLYSFFTIQDAAVTFKTNEALMKSGKVPYLQPFSKYFVNDEKYTQFANTSKDCQSFDDCAKKSNTNKGMTLVIDEFAINFQVATAVKNEARMLLPIESLLTVYYEMIIKKKHPITKKFQNLMEKVVEAGIPRKLITEAVGTTVVNKAGIAIRTLTSKSYSCQYGCTLTIGQLGGVFYVVIFGCVASTVIFLVEIVGNRRNNVVS